MLVYNRRYIHVHVQWQFLLPLNVGFMTGHGCCVVLLGKIHALHSHSSPVHSEILLGTFPSLYQQSIDLFSNLYSNLDSVSYRKLGWVILTTLVQSVEKTSRLKGIMLLITI